MNQSTEGRVDIPVERRLALLIGAPRSGTTLLMRILASHSQIYGRPEPHLLTPLAHLGYFETVDAAPFDHLQAAESARSYVADLPHGEQDYLDACRAYMDILYGRMLAARAPEKHYFLDKTPANALILPFLTDLYPTARYIVLTRHPLAIFCSYAESFFDGDFAAAQRFNPILDRYMPAIAAFLRRPPVSSLHVRYEALASAPDIEVRRICEFLGLSYEPSMLDYGNFPIDGSGLGDPTGVGRHTRPVTDSLQAWAARLAQNRPHWDMMRAMVMGIDDADLEIWGYPRRELFAPVEAAALQGGHPLPRPARFDRFLLQRKLLRYLRHDIANNRFGAWVRWVRRACDILLRG